MVDMELFLDICCVISSINQQTIMAIYITEECINCGACEPECPNNAIYEGEAQWRYADGTTLKTIDLEDGKQLNAQTPQAPFQEDIYFVVADKCTECVGHHDEPQCVAVCPVDCCIVDADYPESRDELMDKFAWLQGS